MTMLIFKTALRTFATTAWTAQTQEGEVLVEYLTHKDHPEGRVYFHMSMEEFLARKVGDTIDLRSGDPR